MNFKKAFSFIELMLILVFMFVVLAAVMMPAVTRRHSGPTTRQGHGAYICYKDDSGNLKHILYKGNKILEQNADGCDFKSDKPQNAKHFLVQVIGAGSSGTGTDADFDPATNPNLHLKNRFEDIYANKISSNNINLTTKKLINSDDKSWWDTYSSYYNSDNWNNLLGHYCAYFQANAERGHYCNQTGVSGCNAEIPQCNNTSDAPSDDKYTLKATHLHVTESPICSSTLAEDKLLEKEGLTLDQCQSNLNMRTSTTNFGYDIGVDGSNVMATCGLLSDGSDYRYLGVTDKSVCFSSYYMPTYTKSGSDCLPIYGTDQLTDLYWCEKESSGSSSSSSTTTYGAPQTLPVVYQCSASVNQEISDKYGVDHLVNGMDEYSSYINDPTKCKQIEYDENNNCAASDPFGTTSFTPNGDVQKYNYYKAYAYQCADNKGSKAGYNTLYPLINQTFIWYLNSYPFPVLFEGYEECEDYINLWLGYNLTSDDRLDYSAVGTMLSSYTSNPYSYASTYDYTNYYYVLGGYKWASRGSVAPTAANYCKYCGYRLQNLYYYQCQAYGFSCQKTNQLGYNVTTSTADTTTCTPIISTGGGGEGESSSSSEGEYCTNPIVGSGYEGKVYIPLHYYTSFDKNTKDYYNDNALKQYNDTVDSSHDRAPDGKGVELDWESGYSGNKFRTIAQGGQGAILPKLDGTECETTSFTADSRNDSSKDLLTYSGSDTSNNLYYSDGSYSSNSCTATKSIPYNKVELGLLHAYQIEPHAYSSPGNPGKVRQRTFVTLKDTDLDNLNIKEGKDGTVIGAGGTSGTNNGNGGKTCFAHFCAGGGKTPTASLTYVSNPTVQAGSKSSLFARLLRLLDGFTADLKDLLDSFAFGSGGNGATYNGTNCGTAYDYNSGYLIYNDTVKLQIPKETTIGSGTTWNRHTSTGCGFTTVTEYTVNGVAAGADGYMIDDNNGVLVKNITPPTSGKSGAIIITW